MSPVKPLCKCGARAHLHKKYKEVYFKCTFCNCKTSLFKTEEEARKQWVKKRGRIKWY